jgi:hypothetical protein
MILNKECEHLLKAPLGSASWSVFLTTNHEVLGSIHSGFGGLGVCLLASGTQDRGFAPDQSRRIFPVGKVGKIHSMQYDTIQTTIESPIPEQ